MHTIKGLLLLVGVAFFFFVILQWGYEMTRRTCFHAMDQAEVCDGTLVCKKVLGRGDGNQSCVPRFGGVVFEDSPIKNWFSQEDGTAVIIESRNPNINQK